MDTTDREVTEFLYALGIGEKMTLGGLFSETYVRLRDLAHTQRRHWFGNETLGTTALVHEAYLKLSENEPCRWKNRGHFFSVAARAMRHTLINYAKHARREKRGGDSPHISIEEASPALDSQIEELLSLDEALTRLERLSPRQARVVECRFFAGLDVVETAEALDISLATVKRDWKRGQAWLYKIMKDE